MLENFIYSKKKSLFETALNNGEVLDEAIVFIEDTKEIWNHGTYFDGSTFDSSNIEASIQNIIDSYATKAEIPTKLSQLENDANYIQDGVVSDGVYAVDANGKLIDYNTADSSCLGVALVKREHKFMIAKADATNDGSKYNFYYDYDKGDLSLTNYSKADGTNSYGYLGAELSDGFTTWTEGALSDFNGKTNTQVIAASSSNARDMCKVLETFNAGSDNQGHSDWYVPACGQLALMYLAKTDINAALAKIGGTALESDTYWSSSEYDSSSAWRVDFGSGGVYSNLKNSGYRVRFVRDISVKPLKKRVSDLESDKADKDSVYSIEEIDSMFALSKYEFVDLGLPSGLKWATTNVGATKPEDFGLYFAWGETEGYEGITDEKQFSWADYKLCGGSNSTLTKYNNNSSYGTVDTLTTLEQVDDAAYTSDKTCRMPTKADFIELTTNTTSTWETLNGVKGRRFTSKTNGNSIFVPAAGGCIDGSVGGVGSVGSLQSSSLYESDSSNAWGLVFDSDYVYMNSNFRCYGFSVRAVQEANTNTKFNPSEIASKVSKLESKISALELQIQEILTQIQ